MKNITKYKSGLIYGAMLALIIAVAPLKNSAEALPSQLQHSVCFNESIGGHYYVRYCCEVEHLSNPITGDAERYQCGAASRVSQVGALPSGHNNGGGNNEGGDDNVGSSSLTCVCFWGNNGYARFSGGCTSRPPYIPANAVCTQN